MEAKRQISLRDGIAIAVSMVIGSGLFGLPGLAVQAAGPMNALYGWLVVIAIMPAMICIFSHFGQRYPASDGISLFASMGFGPWSKEGILLLTTGTLLVGMPAFFLVGGSYLAALFHIETTEHSTLFALFIAVVTTGANIIGVRKLGWFNGFSVLLILVIIGAVVLEALPVLPLLFTANTDNSSHVGDISLIWLSSTIVFWAFQGWENLTFGFGEIRDPERNIPLIFWWSFVIVSVCYFLFAMSVSASALAGAPVSGLSGLVPLLPFGPVGIILLAVMVLILIANANSWVFGASRAFFSAAKGGVLPRFLGYETANGVPVGSLCAALLFYMAVILLMRWFQIKPEIAFLATTQGFIILYGGSILAFTRSTTGLFNRVVSLTAAIGWLFLMQGFGMLIFYSLAWFAVGCLIGLLNRGRERTV